MRNWTNREFDTTILTWGGLIIAALVIIGIFGVHIFTPSSSLLSPEIIMALIGLPVTILSYAMGKRIGEKK